MKENRLTPHWRLYKDAGFSIIPIIPMEQNGRGDWVCTCNSPHCQAAGKHPTIRRWENVVHTHSDAATHRLINSKCQSFGVSADGWLIVDVDPRNGGGVGLEKLEEALDCYLEDIAGLTVETGGGGLHYYFKAPEGVKMVTGKKEFPGVDFVHGLHYVVGAGSAHKSGGTYTIKKGSPDKIDYPPQELVDLIERQPWVNGTGGDGEAEPELVEDALMAIPNDDVDYDEWLRIGMALRHWDDDAGYALFVAWSEKSSKFDPADLDRRWASFGDVGAVNVGTIFQRAQLNGWERPRDAVCGDIDEQGKIIPFRATEAQLESMRVMLSTPRGSKPVVAEEDWGLDDSDAAPQPQTAAPSTAQTQTPAAAAAEKPKRGFWEKSTGEMRHTGEPPASSLDRLPAVPPEIKAAPKASAAAMQYKIKLPGWIGTIYDHMARTAWSVQPGAIAAAAIQAVAVAGRGVKGYNGASTSLITMVIAASASGKEHPQRVFHELLQSVGIDVYAEMRSDKDLVYGLVDGDGKACYLVDEAHTLFGAAGAGDSVKRVDKASLQLGGMLLKVGTATKLPLPRNWMADIEAREGAEIEKMRKKQAQIEEGKGVWKQRPADQANMEYARLEALIGFREERLRKLKTNGIDNVRFNMLCSSTPSMFSEYIDETAINNGLAGRSLIFDCGHKADYPRFEAPPRDAQRRAEIDDFIGRLREAGELGLEVEASSGAVALFRQFHDKMSQPGMADDPQTGPVNRRSSERVSSLASILAMGNQTHEGIFLITEEIAQTAIDLVEMHLATCRFMLSQTMAEDSQIDSKAAIQQRVLHIMQKTTSEEPMAYSVLRQRFLAAKKWKTLIKRLTDEGPKSDNDRLGQEIIAMLRMGLIDGAVNKACWITPKGRESGGYGKSL